MTAPIPACTRGAFDQIKEALSDTSSTLLMVQQLAVLGSAQPQDAAVLHKAIARIVEGLIPFVDDAHEAALHIERSS